MTESKEFPDRVTGDMREVDIAIETNVGVHPITIGVECIDHKRRAAVTWVEYIHSKHQDLEGVHRTVAVSKSGFSKAALEKAKHYGITTFTLQEAEESNWLRHTPRLLSLKELSTEFIFVVRKGVKVLVAPPSPPPYPPPPQLGREEDCILYDPADHPRGSVAQAVEEALNEPAFKAQIEQEAIPNAGKTFRLEAIYRNGTYIFDLSGTKHEVSHIEINGELHNITSTIPLERANYGTVSLLHGIGEFLGQSMPVAFIEQADGTLQFGVSFPKSDEHKGGQAEKKRQG